jgi:hypothetical protein
MKCSKIELYSLEFFSNQLGLEKKKELEAHLSSCNACRTALYRAKVAWNRLNDLPEAEPGPAVRIRFNAMLSAEKRKFASERTGRLRRILSLIHPPHWNFLRPAVGFALPVALLALGFFGGFAIRGSLSGKGDVSVLRTEVTEMRRMLTLSLLNQTSSTERLRGVQVSRQAEKTDGSVLEALLNTLNNDPSTNVRLAAVDALYIFRDRSHVREALVLSLGQQNSPLVQLSIIDLLVEIRERKAMDALRLLIENGGTNATVKARAEWGVKQLT